MVLNKENNLQVEAVTSYNKGASVEQAPNIDMKPERVSSVQNNDGFMKVLDDSIKKTCSLYCWTLKAMNDVKGNEANHERWIILSERARRLSDHLESTRKFRDGRVKRRKEKEQVEKITIPENIPPLQLLGDDDRQVAGLVHDNIERFLTTFEMIVFHQHGIDLSKHWEKCFISSVLHSSEKTNWYQDCIMGRKLSWIDAKKLIVEKFTRSVQDVYLQMALKYHDHTRKSGHYYDHPKSIAGRKRLHNAGHPQYIFGRKCQKMDGP